MRRPPSTGCILIGLLAGASALEAQSGFNPAFEFKQCDEDVLGLRVDPGPAQELVGPELPLVLEEGRARIAIMIQDCGQYWIDGEDLGPNQHVHVLAMVQGGGDVRPVIGAEATEPTMTWFSLFAGSTNPRDRAARLASRTAPEPIGPVTLDPPGSDRGGEVTIGPDLRFSWNVPAAAPLTRLMGVNHDIYVRDDTGMLVLKRIQAIGKLVASPSPGALRVSGDGRLAGLIGAGRYPVLVYTFVPLWARGNLGVPPGR